MIKTLHRIQLEQPVQCRCEAVAAENVSCSALNHSCAESTLLVHLNSMYVLQTWVGNTEQEANADEHKPPD